MASEVRGAVPTTSRWISCRIRVAYMMLRAKISATHGVAGWVEGIASALMRFGYDVGARDEPRLAGEVFSHHKRPMSPSISSDACPYAYHTHTITAASFAYSRWTGGSVFLPIELVSGCRFLSFCSVKYLFPLLL